MDYKSKFSAMGKIKFYLKQFENETRNLYYGVRCGCRAESELDDVLSLIPAIEQGLRMAATDIINGEEVKYAHKK